MPLMVNHHGLVTCINEDAIATNVARGLRLVDESDELYLAGDTRNAFATPDVQGFTKGQLGRRMIQVRGKGPSWQPAAPDAYVIDINGRRDNDCGAVLCLDREAWAHIEADNCVRFYPKGYHMPEASHAFTMPIQPVKGFGDKRMRLREGAAIRNAHFSGIAAVLVALYLTDGPVVISGFDLSGNDAAGSPYTRQLVAWEAAAKLWDRVEYDQPRQFGGDA